MNNPSPIPTADPAIASDGQMNFQISSEQTMLVDVFEQLFAEHSTGARIRATGHTGFDPALWAEVVQTGTPLMRVAEDAGGVGMTLFDAVLVAEVAGRYLASVPLVETIVTARLLSQLGTPEAQEWLTRIGSGDAVATLALHPAGNGRTQLVPAAAIAQLVVACDGERVVLIPSQGPATPAEGRAAANFGSIPAAMWTPPAPFGANAAVDAAAVAAFGAAIEEWKLLTAAMIAAAGRHAIENAATYAKERQAFGKPIGSYQGLAHPLADSWVDIDGARLLVWRAAWMIAHEPQAAGAAISEAAWWTASVIGNAVIRSMRAFGGYGMTNEYDAELYFRRAKAWSLVAGDPANELRRVGDRLWADAAVALPEGGEVSIDFGYGAEAEAFASQVRAFFEANLTPELRRFTYETTDGHDLDFQKKLAAAGLLYPDWPKTIGGDERSKYEMSALKRVYGDYDWWTSVVGVSSMVGRVIDRFGSEELRQEILPRAAAGEINFALGYSEPSGGSDVFAAKTRAVKDGDYWVIDGSKMFTSQGHMADYTLMITRTNTEAPKHAGVTMFLVPLDQPGYSCQEIVTVGGERTNTTFYEGMRVPDRYRLGPVDGGASVMAYALTLEHSAADFYYSALDRQLRHAIAWAQTPGQDGAAPIASADVRSRLAKVKVRRDMLDALGRRCLWSGITGCQHKSYGPMGKLFGSESWIASTAELMELMAPDVLMREMSDTGIIEQEHRKSIASTVYAGVSEVMRSLIAESALALPRSRM